jgi:hypothetical protein
MALSLRDKKLLNAIIELRPSLKKNKPYSAASVSRRLTLKSAINLFRRKP